MSITQNNSLQLAFPSGVGRRLPQGGAWSSTLCLRLCSFNVHFSKEQFAIGFPVRRRSDSGRPRGVVVRGLDNHGQEDKDTVDHEQSRRSPWSCCPLYSSAWS